MLLRGLMDLFAQYERAVIRARTRAALAVKRSKGEQYNFDSSSVRPQRTRQERDTRKLLQGEAARGVCRGAGPQ